MFTTHIGTGINGNREPEGTEEGSQPSQAESVQKGYRRVPRGSSRCLRF